MAINGDGMVEFLGMTGYRENRAVWSGGVRVMRNEGNFPVSLCGLN